MHVPSRGFAAARHDDLFVAAALAFASSTELASTIMEGLFYNVKYG
jgi:hypothetical protein